MSSREPDKLPIDSQSPPPAVPAFGCIVYLRRCEEGVSGRVANLADIEVTAANERAALAQIVPAFKARIIELMKSETEIPWIDPPPDLKPDEQKRFLPVHL